MNQQLGVMIKTSQVTGIPISKIFPSSQWDQVVSFCDKTTKETDIKINDTELIQTTNLSQTITKNVITASVTNIGQEENISLITVINFVEQTMTTSKYGEQLKTQLDFSLTQQAM